MFRRLTAVCLALFASTQACYGLAGDVDEKNEYAYVIHVITQGNYACSGVALSPRLVATAAHCLWDGSAYRAGVRVRYISKGNTVHYVAARKLIIPEEYPPLARAERLYKSNKRSEKNTQKLQEAVYRSVSEDAGFIILDESLNLTIYAKTLLHGSLPFHSFLMNGKPGVWSEKRIEQAWKLMKEALGPHLRRREFAFAVGFGDSHCKNWDDRTTCEQSDGRRRMGSVKLFPGWEIMHSIGPVLVLQTGSFSKINPINAGDSGGGVFVRLPRVDHPVLIGLMSKRSPAIALHSSFLYHGWRYLALLNSEEYRNAMHEVPTIALAAAKARVDRREYVATGAAKRSSEEAAKQAALATCAKDNVKKCKIVEIAQEGCAFIAVGHRKNRGVKWALGASAGEAFRKCSRGGFICKQPIGYCLE